MRAKTVNLERLSLRDRAVARAAEPDDGKRRLPMTRGDCVDGPRPCPFVSCRHHLLLDVEGDGSSLKINFPDLVADDEVRLDEMPATCALDVADHGGTTLDHVGEVMNVTRERIRQVEERLLAKIAARHPDRLGRAHASRS